MLFYKKILVLKQLEKDFGIAKKTVSGIARIEIDNGVAEFFLSVINLAPPNGGKYYVFLTDGKGKPFCFEWQKRDSLRTTFPTCPNPDSFSIGVVFVKDYLPVTVAYSCTESGIEQVTEFKKIVAEYFSEKRAREIKKEPILEKPTSVPEPPLEYNDEAVATENYFEFDDIKDKLDKIKEFDFATLPPENELPFSNGKEETQKIHTGCDCAQNEKSNDFSKEPDKKQRYYLSVKQELDEIFLKFPTEPNLEKIFYKSRWAKVFYSETKYYVVGVVFEDQTEKYICYGVPCKYSKEPPKELKGYCSFIPLSIFSMHGDGYWMMFQDAQTGECKKPV